MSENDRDCRLSLLVQRMSRVCGPHGDNHLLAADGPTEVRPNGKRHMAITVREWAW